MHRSGSNESSLIESVMGVCSDFLKEPVRVQRKDMAQRLSESLARKVEARSKVRESALSEEQILSAVQDNSVDLTGIDRDQFLQGVRVEFEHDDVTKGDLAATVKIALAHLREIPDYYTKLAKMEQSSISGAIEGEVKPADELDFEALAQEEGVDAHSDEDMTVISDDMEEDLKQMIDTKRTVTDTRTEEEKMNEEIKKALAIFESRKVAKKKLVEASVGKKRYYTMGNVGNAKYTVSFHDGVQKHKDGSDFYGIKTFRNKSDEKAFTDKLDKEGYRRDSGHKNESVNESKKVNERSVYPTIGEDDRALLIRLAQDWLKRNMPSDGKIYSIKKGADIGMVETFKKDMESGDQIDYSSANVATFLLGKEAKKGDKVAEELYWKLQDSAYARPAEFKHLRGPADESKSVNEEAQIRQALAVGRTLKKIKATPQELSALVRFVKNAEMGDDDDTANYNATIKAVDPRGLYRNMLNANGAQISVPGNSERKPVTPEQKPQTDTPASKSDELDRTVEESHIEEDDAAKAKWKLAQKARRYAGYPHGKQGGIDVDVQDALNADKEIPVVKNEKDPLEVGHGFDSPFAKFMDNKNRMKKANESDDKEEKSEDDVKLEKLYALSLNCDNPAEFNAFASTYWAPHYAELLLAAKSPDDFVKKVKGFEAAPAPTQDTQKGKTADDMPNAVASDTKDETQKETFEVEGKKKVKESEDPDLNVAVAVKGDKEDEQAVEKFVKEVCDADATFEFDGEVLIVNCGDGQAKYERKELEALGVFGDKKEKADESKVNEAEDEKHDGLRLVDDLIDSIGGKWQRYDAKFGIANKSFNNGNGSLAAVAFDTERKTIVANKSILKKITLDAVKSYAEKLGWNYQEVNYGYPEYYNTSIKSVARKEANKSNMEMVDKSGVFGGKKEKADESKVNEQDNPVSYDVKARGFATSNDAALNKDEAGPVRADESVNERQLDDMEMYVFANRNSMDFEQIKEKAGSKIGDYPSFFIKKVDGLITSIYGFSDTKPLKRLFGEYAPKFNEGVLPDFDKDGIGEITKKITEQDNPVSYDVKARGFATSNDASLFAKSVQNATVMTDDQDKAKFMVAVKKA